MVFVPLGFLAEDPKFLQNPSLRGPLHLPLTSGRILLESFEEADLRSAKRLAIFLVGRPEVERHPARSSPFLEIFR
jgi:hypothetical protein